jgi:hypothetical protein
LAVPFRPELSGPGRSFGWVAPLTNRGESVGGGSRPSRMEFPLVIGCLH